MITIMIIGLLSSVFGLLMIFAPSIVIKAEESANQLYMTDAALMKNRIPLGIFMLLASGFLFYSCVYRIVRVRKRKCSTSHPAR